MPINSNHSFNNMGRAFNVTKVLTDGKLDDAKYQAYSQPWITAGYITSFFWYFALYGASEYTLNPTEGLCDELTCLAVSYVILYHRQQIAHASRTVWRSALHAFRIRRWSEDDEENLDEDVHARLMRRYTDVPEWVYTIVLVVAAAIGMIGIGIYPSDTSPVVVVFGIIMTFIAVIPIGLINSVTGIQVGTNVLAEFIGGSFVEGNANALM
jgi:hypothetical protein